MIRIFQAFVLVFFSMLFFAEAYTQTSIYTTAGVGNSGIKVLKLSSGGLANTFKSGYYQHYEIGVNQRFANRLSFKGGGGYSIYACSIGLPEWAIPPEGYEESLNRFHYLSFPIGLQYNPKWNAWLEVGIHSNFFRRHTYDNELQPQFFYNINKYTPIPYWGVSYVFFDMLEVGYVNHLYLSKFADYSTWWDQQQGNEPDTFFKHNVWYLNVSLKIRLSKRDE